MNWIQIRKQIMPKIQLIVPYPEAHPSQNFINIFVHNFCSNLQTQRDRQTNKQSEDINSLVELKTEIPQRG